MVRNNELRATSDTSRTLAARVQAALTAKGYSQAQVGYVIGRAQSYASLRLKGLRPWNIDELDAIARILGYGDAMTLITAMRGAETDRPDGDV